MRITMTPAELIEFIKPILEHVAVTLYLEDNTLCSNLNTGMKSQCILKIENNELIAYRRYDRVDKVEDFNHLLDLVLGCRHAREYMNPGWHTLLQAMSLLDKE